MPKSTENRMLGYMANGVVLTPHQNDKLLDKVGKDQSKSRARKITSAVEAQYATQLANMTAGEQIIVRQAVSDYTNSSQTINDSCRNGNPSAAVANLDAAFQIFTNHGYTVQERVVYRLLTYKPPAVCPYGAAAAPQIVAGDLICEPAFVSTSEHRQFLVDGNPTAPAGSRYVKFVMIGQGGANFSGGAYNNAIFKTLLKSDYPKTHMLRTAGSGQAEILYPRGLYMRIESVVANGNDFHVRASILNPQPAAGTPAKNAFTG